jgi:hypothetical protein
MAGVFGNVNTLVGGQAQSQAKATQAAATAAATPMRYNPNDPTQQLIAPGLVMIGGYYYQIGSDGSLQHMSDPNVAAQVTKNLAIGSGYDKQAPGWSNGLMATIGQQDRFGNQLQNTITNPNAPSVAQEQLSEATNANEGQQLSLESGVGGENGAIARSNAANNIAGLGATTAQDQALLRAKEVADAQGQYGNLLANKATETKGMFDATSGLGYNYNSLGQAGQLGGNANATAVRGQDIGLLKDVATGTGSIAAAGATGGASAAVPAAGAGDSLIPVPTSYNSLVPTGEDELKRKGLYGG